MSSGSIVPGGRVVGCVRCADAAPRLHSRFPAAGLRSAVRRTDCLGEAETTRLAFSPPFFCLRFYHGKHAISSAILVDEFSIILSYVEYDC